MTWEDKGIKAKKDVLIRLDELLESGHGEIIVKVSKSSGRIIIRKSEDEQVEG